MTSDTILDENDRQNSLDMNSFRSCACEQSLGLFLWMSSQSGELLFTFKRYHKHRIHHTHYALHIDLTIVLPKEKNENHAIIFHIHSFPILLLLFGYHIGFRSAMCKCASVHVCLCHHPEIIA